MFIVVVDGHRQVQETACGQPCRAVARPDGATGDRIGDLDQDIGVVRKAEPLGDAHDLVGGVGGQDAGDLREFGVRNRSHLLIERGQFPVAGDVPDRVGAPGGKHTGDDCGRAAHGQQRSFGILQPPFP